MTKNKKNTEYVSPAVEIIKLKIETDILGMSVGVGGWAEDAEDFGGTAT